MSRKKVLFVLPVMKGGGAEKVALSLLENLDRSRFEPRLALFNKEGEYLRNVPGDVEIFDLGKKSRLSFFSLILKLRRLVREQRPDVVLSSLYYPNMITVLSRLGTGAGPRVILSEHSNHKKLLRYKRFSGLVRRLMAFTYRRADRIVTVSAALKDDLVSDLGVAQERIDVIYNPTDNAAVQELSAEEVSHPFFDDGGEGFVVVSVGRLTRAKNYEVLLEAMAAVRREAPARLIIVGHGELEASLKARTRELGLDDCVGFVGFQHNPYKWLKRSDLFVLASSWEGFGIATVEAMACGTPSIMSACHNGRNEIITDREDGLVVPVGDAAALSAAILELAGNEELREKLIRGGLARAGQFDSAQIVKRYEEVIDSVLT